MAESWPLLGRTPVASFALLALPGRRRRHYVRYHSVTGERREQTLCGLPWQGHRSADYGEQICRACMRQMQATGDADG